MERCSLNEADELLRICSKVKDMIFISTPFSRAAANRLEKFNVPVYKIGSGVITILVRTLFLWQARYLEYRNEYYRKCGKGSCHFDKHKVPVALLHTTNLPPIHLVCFGAMNCTNLSLIRFLDCQITL
jgi:N-acetylneuraminate synthase